MCQTVPLPDSLGLARYSAHSKLITLINCRGSGFFHAEPSV